MDLTVEREVVGEDGVARRYRLTATFDAGASEGPLPSDELRDRFKALAQELDHAVPSGAAEPGRPDRSLPELVETYRPRQRELIDLLLAEGEVSEEEAARLRTYLEERATGVSSEVPITERPIAAAPLASDRAPTTSRPVPELLRLYKIESLRQAGAVRARRQISYEEYMALKRHFAVVEPAAGAAHDGADGPRT